jgi:signal transduction histidine kinase/HAMP domain-containing protein
MRYWFSKTFGDLPLRRVLVLPCALQILAATGLVGFLSFKNGEAAVSNLSSQLMHQVHEHVEERLREYLTIPGIINQLNANSLYLNQLNPQTNEGLTRHFWQQRPLLEKSHISAVYFGNAQGGFTGLGFQADQAWRVGRADRMTNGDFYSYAVDAQGKITHLISQGKGYDPRIRPWYRSAVQSQQPVWTPVYLDFKEPRLKITLSQSVYDQKRTFLGVAGVDLVLSHVSDFLKQVDIGHSGQAFIIERSGLMVASSVANQPLFTTDKEGQVVGRVGAAESQVPLVRETAEYLETHLSNVTTLDEMRWFRAEIAGQRQFIQVTPLKNVRGLDWLLVVVVPQSDFMGQIQRNTQFTLLLCLGVLAGGIALSLLTTRQLTAAIQRLVQASRLLGQGKLDASVPRFAVRELNELSTVFNQMSQEVQDSQDRLQDYARSLEQNVRDRTQDLEQQILEREQTELALESANAELHGVFAAMDQFIFIVNAEGRILKIPSSQRDKPRFKTGIELLDKRADEVFPPDVAHILMEFLRQTLTTQQIQNVEYSLIVQGEEIWYEASISPISRERAIWVARDITDRKQAEQELQQKNQQLEQTLHELKTTQSQLIRSEKMAVLGRLVAGVAHEMNTPLAAIQASNQNILSLLDQSLADLPELLQALSTSQQQDFFSFLNQALAATPSLLSLSSREKRQLRKELLRKIEHQRSQSGANFLQADSETLAELLLETGIHERFESLLPILQIPESEKSLQTIYQLSSLRRSASTIAIATEKATKVVLALRSYTHQNSRAEAVPIDLVESLETTLSLYQHQLKRQVQVERQYEEVPPVLGFADELPQVWANLIDNALQAMNYQGTLTLSTMLCPEQVVVRIADTGPGISPEHLVEIFDPLFTTKPMGEGTGLGLSIVKKIIDHHEGTINVESVPGNTVFTVTLPLVCPI